MVEMFSKTEMMLFGVAFFTAIIVAIFIYLGLGIYERIKEKEHKVENRRSVSNTDFERIAKEALSYQRMLSFIMETEIGEIEFIKEGDNGND